MIIFYQKQNVHAPVVSKVLFGLDDEKAVAHRLYYISLAIDNIVMITVRT